MFDNFFFQPKTILAFFQAFHSIILMVALRINSDEDCLFIEGDSFFKIQKIECSSKNSKIIYTSKLTLQIAYIITVHKSERYVYKVVSEMKQHFQTTITRMRLTVLAICCLAVATQGSKCYLT